MLTLETLRKETVTNAHHNEEHFADSCWRFSNTQNKESFDIFRGMSIIFNLRILRQRFAFRNGTIYPVFPYVKFN